MMNFMVKFNQVDTKKYFEGYCLKEKFIEFCQECSNYNTNYSCPPFTYDLLEELKSYKHIHLIGAKIDLNPASLKQLQTLEEKFVYGKTILHAARELLDGKLLKLEQAYPGSKGYFAGSCILCEDCLRPEAKPCIYPQKVRPSLEAMGFDLAKTAKELLEIDMIWSEDYLPAYYTLVSGFATNADFKEFADLFVEA